MSVSSSRFCLRDPLGELLRARAHRAAAACPAAAASADRAAAPARRRMRVGLGLPVDFRIAVDDDVAEVGEQLGRAVAARRELEQLRRLVDERRGDVARQERRVGDHVLEERDVRLHAADAELAQRAVHALAGVLGTRGPRR